MAEGFVVDASHGTAGVSTWVEGPPQKGVWTGVKFTGRARSEIATWRCSRCGFLEHYAPAAPDRSQDQAQHRQLFVVLVIALAVLLAVLGAFMALR